MSVADIAKRVRSLEAEVQRLDLAFALTDNEPDLALIKTLRADVKTAREQLVTAQRNEPATPMFERAPVADVGLGRDTTGLEACVRVRMDRLATSMAHMYALRRTRLVTIDVENFGNKPARVAVRCRIEGYSAEAVAARELAAAGSEGSKYAFDLFPPLFPQAIRSLTDLTAAALHVEVLDLDAKTELLQTLPIGLLPPTTAVLGYIDPSTQEVIDQRDLLAAWVTPNAPAVLEVLRTAADFSKLKSMFGALANQAEVREHVRAIYQALNAASIVYIDSRIAFGASVGQSVQRVRLPRESLASRSANCIDGTVLMASLLEATGIEPTLVIVPGHAYLGFRPDPSNASAYEYVETTLIGTKPFEEATAVATTRTLKATAIGSIRHLDLKTLRDSGITPME